MRSSNGVPILNPAVATAFAVLAGFSSSRSGAGRRWRISGSEGSDVTASVERKDEPVSDAIWRRFVLTFLAVLLGGLAVLFALIIVIDPYDTGRFPTFMPVGVSDENQQTASASNGRNPIFDAAVFGNSHGMLLSPAQLDKLTGLSSCR